MYKIKKITGFTLAEVLITLLIIGIIASMVIPSLIQDTQNAELRTAARKALSAANQAYKLATVDNGGGFGPHQSGDTTQAIVKFDALKSKLNVIKECPYNSHAIGNCWASSGVGEKDYYVEHCGSWSNAGNYQNSNNSFVTSDGMFWMLYSYSENSGSQSFIVDVNGNKGPNDWAKDIFYFKINDINITPATSFGCSFHHNDSTPVATSEFLVPFK